MVLNNLCVLVIWTKVASQLEGLMLLYEAGSLCTAVRFSPGHISEPVNPRLSEDFTFTKKSIIIETVPSPWQPMLYFPTAADATLMS